MADGRILARYHAEAVRLARGRGYDPEAHAAALAADDGDAISLSHPFNWLTEDEVERFYPVADADAVDARGEALVR